jgi:outer membrane protein OmpA-like peptidoglycan-associated protein
LAAAVGCGPSASQQRVARERDQLRHELREVKQYNDDLKFRLQLVQARSKILTDLVQGLTSDPEHFKLQHFGPGADAALAALDRDMEALIASVRHSHDDVESLRSQRAALQNELAGARSTIEEASAAHAAEDARIAALQKLLAPMLGSIHAGRINVSMTYGELSLRLPERSLFAGSASQLTAEGKELLAQVAAGLVTSSDRQYRVTGPSHGAAAQRQLTAARVAAVIEYLVANHVPATNLVAAARAQSSGERYFELTLLPKFEELREAPTLDQVLGTPSAPPAPETAPR